MGIAAVGHPVLAADDDLAQRALGTRVVERQLAIGEDATQLSLLIQHVAERLGGEVVAASRLAHVACPYEKFAEQRAQVRALSDEHALACAIGGEDRTDTHEPHCTPTGYRQSAASKKDRRQCAQHPTSVMPVASGSSTSFGGPRSRIL
jgi:hypothetical protein